MSLTRTTSWVLRRSLVSAIGVKLPAVARSNKHGVGIANLANNIKSAQLVGGARFLGFADSSKRNISERIQNLVGGYASSSLPKVPKRFVSFLPKERPSEPSKLQESNGSPSEKSSVSNKESNIGGEHWMFTWYMDGGKGRLGGHSTVIYSLIHLQATIMQLWEASDKNLLSFLINFVDFITDSWIHIALFWYPSAHCTTAKKMISAANIAAHMLRI
jgi:hypothetical protein